MQLAVSRPRPLLRETTDRCTITCIAAVTTATTSVHASLLLLQQNFDMNFLVRCEDKVEVHDEGFAECGCIYGPFHKQLERVSRSRSFGVIVDAAVTVVATAVVGGGVFHWYHWRFRLWFR